MKHVSLRGQGLGRRGMPVVWTMVLLLSLATLAAPADAATRYVDASVANSGDGSSWATAYKTVQAALNVAVSGDVVEISGGVYNEALTSKAAGVTVTGSTQAGHNGAVTIKGINGQSVLSVTHQTTWRRLTFDGSANTNASTYAVKVTAGTPTFEQCVIGPGQRLLTVTGGSATFSRCVLKDILGSTMDNMSNSSDAVYLATAGGTVTFNYTMFLDLAYRFIRVQSSTTADFNNCLFAGTKGRLLYVPSGAAQVHWRNCLALSNEGRFGYEGYSIIHNASSSATVALDHCLVQPIAPVNMTTTALYSANVTVTNPLSGAPRLHHGRRPALINVGIDDEINLGVWTKLAAECDIYGFKSTFALNTASATASDWQAIRDGVSRGHEVASHTSNHVVLSKRTNALTIKYANAQATAATVTVDRSAMVMHIVVTGVAGASFDLPLGRNGAYPSLASIKNAINSHSGFTAATSTFSGTSYDTGTFWSQDLAAVQNVSILNATASLNLDDTAMFQDELTLPKQTIETNVPGYTCDALVYPYLEYDDATLAAATAAGYTCARTGENGSYAMGDPAGYNLMLMFALEPFQVFGTNLDEATMRQRVSAFLEWAKFIGAAVGLYAHGEDEYTLAEWRMLLRIMAEDPDVEVVTLAEMARRIKENAQSHTGTTYVRTQWTDNANYLPEPHSPLIDAGAPYAVAMTDFGGTAIPQGATPSVGPYEWPPGTGVASDAGADATVGNGGSGTLDGTGSISPATIASYGWTQVRGPAATLASPGAATSGFTAPNNLAGPRDPVSVLLKLAITGINGTSDYAYKRLTVTWANNPPTATVSGVPTSPTDQFTANLTVGGANVTQYSYSLDSGAWSPATPIATPIVLSNLADGIHRVAVVGADAQGNWQTGPTATTVSWEVKTTPPLAVINGAPTSPTSQTSADLTISGQTVVNYKYRLDGGAWSAARPVATHITLSGLAEGTHTVDVIGQDSRGNWQAEASASTVSWVVSLGTLTAVVNGAPTSPTSLTSLDLTVSGTNITQYKYSLDNGAWSAATPIATHILLSNLAVGAHSLAVIGGDAQNNWQNQASPTTVTWQVIEGPVAVIGGTPTSPTNQTSAELTISGQNITNYKYRLDNGSWSASRSVATHIVLSGLAEGSHTLAVIGQDNWGNWQTEAMATTITWEVKTSAPGQPTIPPGLNPATITNPTPTLAWNAVTGASKYRLEVSRNADFSSPLVQVTVADTSYTLTSAQSLPQTGTYYYRVRAVDAAGNESGWTSGSFDLVANMAVGIAQTMLLLLVP